jgi:exonuclease III
MGDMNVVHGDIDIYDIRNKETQGCCTPEERSNFGDHLDQLNLIDTFRA